VRDKDGEGGGRGRLWNDVGCEEAVSTAEVVGPAENNRAALAGRETSAGIRQEGDPRLLPEVMRVSRSRQRALAKPVFMVSSRREHADAGPQASEQLKTDPALVSIAQDVTSKNDQIG